MNHYPSFRRVEQIPFEACLAALESLQRTGQLPGAIERDADFGNYRIEVLLARGPLRSPVRMQLQLDRWSATATVLELIPCQPVRPSAAYFAAGKRLIDSLTGPLPASAPAPVRVSVMRAA